jgi:hypothetical protein
VKTIPEKSGKCLEARKIFRKFPIISVKIPGDRLEHEQSK